MSWKIGHFHFVKIVEEQGKQIADLKVNGGSTTFNENSNITTNTEWRDVLIGKRKKTQSQIDIINVIGNEQKDRKKRENNIMLFGVPASKATTEEERKVEDKQTVVEILKEITIQSLYLEETIAKVTRFNPNRQTDKPPPIRVEFIHSEIPNLNVRDTTEILKNAKALKNSEKHSKVFVGLDLTETQICHLKNLVKSRNEQNTKLEAANATMNRTATYRYGIRNNMVVKIFFKDL
jgi:hypothetical protein